MSREHLANLHGASGKQEVQPEGQDQLQGVQQAGMHDEPPHLAALGSDSGPLVPGVGGPQVLTPGTQMFQPRQRVMMGKVDTDISFDGESNCTGVTED
jgi:hypothetical protein